MIYDHIVKSNGVYYPAGTEVPDTAEPLPFSDTSPNDSEITLETEAVAETSTTSRRGRPKKED